MINLLFWVVFGALVGWIASMIMGTNDEQGPGGNIIIGIIGAVIGGFIARSLGGSGVTGFNLRSFVAALGGALILIAVLKLFTRSSTR